MATRLEFLGARPTTDPAGEILIFQDDRVNRIDSALLGGSSGAEWLFAAFRPGSGGSCPALATSTNNRVALNYLEGNLGSLSSELITLPAGTYNARATACNYGFSLSVRIQFNMVDETNAAPLCSQSWGIPTAAPFPTLLDRFFTLTGTAQVSLNRVVSANIAALTWTATINSYEQNAVQLIIQKLA